MPQPGFFDLDERFAKLDGIGDPLLKIRAVVDWEGFRPILEAAQAKPRQSAAGRKAFDAVLMFRILVLQQLYNLSDDQTEYQIRDRYSFGRFLDLTPEDVVPDAKTLWRYRESLKSAAVFDQLFAELTHHESASRGYLDDPANVRGNADEEARFAARWAQELADDPLYNPNLALAGTAYALAWPPRTGTGGAGPVR